MSQAADAVITSSCPRGYDAKALNPNRLHAGFAARAASHRPLVPAVAGEQAAQILHRLMGEGQHAAIAGLDEFGGRDMVLVSIVMTAAEFDRLAAWDADWSELEDGDQDLTASFEEDFGVDLPRSAGIADLVYAEDDCAISEPDGSSEYSSVGWRVTVNGLEDDTELDADEPGHRSIPGGNESRVAEIDIRADLVEAGAA